MKALTVLQPYAHQIVLGTKRVENRVWETRHRGLIAIHAGKAIYQDDVDWVERLIRRKLDLDAMDYGAVIGVAEIAKMVTEHKSPWFVGPVGWVLRNVRAIKPVPCPGAQRLWTLPPSVEAQVLARL